MGRRKKECNDIYIIESDKCEFKYNLYTIDRLKLLLSPMCEYMFVRNGKLNDRYLDTINLILEKVMPDIIYEIRSYVHDLYIIFEYTDCNNRLWLFKIDDTILNTCFGLCVIYEGKRIYVDFDKYF